MKRYFLYSLQLLLVVLMNPVRLSAQETGRMDTLPPVIIRSTSLVDQKVTDAFKKGFKEAVNPRWYKMNKLYLVKFMSAEQKNHNLYNDKGYLIYNISYGDKEYLPSNVRYQVVTEYPTHKIVTAIHVNQAGRSIWVVNLEGGRDLVLARVEDGQLNEVERVKKAM